MCGACWQDADGSGLVDIHELELQMRSKKEGWYRKQVRHARPPLTPHPVLPQA